MGVEFNIKAELSTLPEGDGRRAPRRIVNLAAALREAGATTAAITVINISTDGFKAEGEEPFQRGGEVWLKLPGFEARRSHIVWANGKEAGCKFENPLHQSELDMITCPRPRRIAKDVFRRS
jgi:hypothetical protein